MMGIRVQLGILCPKTKVLERVRRWKELSTAPPSPVPKGIEMLLVAQCQSASRH